MAKPLDLEFQALATELIQEFGSKVTVTRQGVTIGSGFGVFVTESSSLDGSDPMVQTIVKSRRMKLTNMSGEPQPGDVLKADKQDWKIRGVSRIRPNDLTIAYEVEV